MAETKVQSRVDELLSGIVAAAKADIAGREKNMTELDAKAPKGHKPGKASAAFIAARVKAAVENTPLGTLHEVIIEEVLARLNK